MATPHTTIQINRTWINFVFQKFITLTDANSRRGKDKASFPLISNPSSKPYGEKSKGKLCIMEEKKKKNKLLGSQLTYPT